VLVENVLHFLAVVGNYTHGPNREFDVPVYEDSVQIVTSAKVEQNAIRVASPIVPLIIIPPVDDLSPFV